MNDGERKAWPCGHVRCAGVRRREARGVPVADGMAVATRNAATATRAPRQAKPRVSLAAGSGRVWSARRTCPWQALVQAYVLAVP